MPEILGWLAWLIPVFFGIIYGKVRSGKENYGRIILFAFILGIILGLLSVFFFSALIPSNLLAMLIGGGVGIGIGIAVFIYGVLFAIGAWIGDKL